MGDVGSCQDVDETADITIHDVVYSVHVHTKGDASLAIEVEQRDDATTWKAQFAAQYIEDITQRTQNFKSFPVFVRMLITALRQESDSVFVDLLTYSDLEILKSKRAGSQQPPTGSGLLAPNNKRYLILTYAAEFDRVHYPLPLQREDNPDPQRLKAIIRQLRQQLEGQQRKPAGLHAADRRPADSLPELRVLRDENASLKQQLRSLESQLACGLGPDVQQLTADAQATIKDLRQMRKERDTLMLRAQHADATLEAERNLHRRELRRRLKEQQELAAELHAAKDQLRELRLKCRELTQELDLAQRRAKVANLSASYLERARQIGPRPAGRSAATMPAGSRGASPAGSRQPSRGTSPAPFRRAPQQPAPPQRSRSAGPERPNSAPRFNPTEYVRQRKDRQQAAADRLDDMRRQQRLQSPSGLPGSRPASRPQSLPASRPSSMPNSRHPTPARSRVPSRDPSADRTSNSSRERGIVARSTEKLRGVVATTYGIPSKEQRATSPGRALLEVKAKLSQFAAQSGSTPGRSSDVGIKSCMPAAIPAPEPTRRAALADDNYLDANIADIDARLQSLQQFLKAAKAAVPARAPA